VYNPTDLLYTHRRANATNILYTQHFLLKICNSKISSFCYARKRPSPFFLYIPTKNPLFNDKVWTYYRILVSKWVKSQKTEKTGPPTNQASAPPQTFLLLLRYNLFIGVDKMLIKISPLLRRLGLVLRFGSVQFFLLTVTLFVRRVSPSADVVYIRY